MDRSLRAAVRLLQRPPRPMNLCARCARCARRQLSTTAPLSSGHSKWSKIKHDKGKLDSRKSKTLGVLSRDIANASKAGGPAADSNPQLAGVIAKAKQAGMSKASMDAAILRGQGKSSSNAPLEAFSLEAVMPPVAFIIEGATDSKLRLLMELRALLKSHGATCTPTAYMFERRGRISFAPKDGVGVDEVLESVLELGALDVEETKAGGVLVDTEPTSLKPVESALKEQFGVDIESSDTIWLPNDDTAVDEIGDDALQELEQLVEKIDECLGIDAIYTNCRQAST